MGQTPNIGIASAREAQTDPPLPCKSEQQESKANTPFLTLMLNHHSYSEGHHAYVAEEATMWTLMGPIGFSFSTTLGITEESNPQTKQAVLLSHLHQKP